MSRVKTFNATGVAPDGRLYSGDLNLIQDQYADLANFSQTHDVGTLRVGDSSLSLLKHGAGEFRLTGMLRTDGIFRGLGGLYAGAFTTAARDALSNANRPYGLEILNTTKNRREWNTGSEASPVWRSPLFGAEPADLPAGLISAAGLLSALPSPSTVAEGSFYYATDQDVLYQQIGGAWSRRIPSAHIVSPCIFSAAPTGWRIMDGTSVTSSGLTDTLRNALIAAGNPYGTSGGNPLLPNTKGRAIVGQDGAQGEFDALGEAGGAKTHVLTVGEIPAHSHPFLNNLLTQVNTGFAAPNPSHASGAFALFVDGVTGPTGGGGAHNNLQPYIAMPYMIHL
jgi:microcystin-dependent protein